MTLEDQNSTYSIRPAGRHILTIGRDLIQDKFAAIIELIKNGYDADANEVNVSLEIPQGKESLKIIIEDDGHGMDKETVVTKWLVPSTDDKLKRKFSPKKGRTMQGRKGVGRYASSFLGNDLLLETVSESGEETIVYVKWDEFEKSEYLDQVPILVENRSSSKLSGTKLTITTQFIDHIQEWNKDEIDRLQTELKKLIPVMDKDIFENAINLDDFSIHLNINYFENGEHVKWTKGIEPFPILQFFDYRIKGFVEASGQGEFVFTNQRSRNTIDEKIAYPEEKNSFPFSANCGKVEFDLRFYDRDREAIDNLINRGLKDERGYPLGKRETRNLLNDLVGIGVYRGGFRIRPTGDPWYDWLSLNRRRVQNPGLRMGSDRVIGFIQIQSEEQSGLEEKSARDGLRENTAYQRLKELSLDVVGLVEQRRYAYLRQAGLRDGATKIERNINKLFGLGGLRSRVEKELSEAGISLSVIEKITDIINSQESQSDAIVKDIQKAVSIYQGQATLGKIVNVILHESRKPLGFITTNSDNIQFWINDYIQKSDLESLQEALNLSLKFEKNSEILTQFFSRIDPLAARRRGKKSQFNLKAEIEDSFLVFENTLIENAIKHRIECDSKLEFYGWSVDIQIILTNLIENSIFWLTQKQNEKGKKISVIVESDAEEFLSLGYFDNGPGIEEMLIESGVIFDPEFSTKPDGTGLGLAIAGEAATRNQLELQAIASDEGAYFRLTPIVDEIEEEE